MSQNLQDFWKKFVDNYVFKLLYLLILLVILTILFGVFHLVYQPVLIVLPSSIAFIIAAYALYRFIYNICMRATFPGYNWIWKRYMESYFQKQTTANLIKDINDLKDVIECVMHEKNFGYSVKCEDVTKIPHSISSIIKLFKKQEVSKTLSKRQKNMMESFSEIQKLVENIKVLSKDDKISASLWNFLQGHQKELIKKINKRPGLILSFEDLNQANFLLAKCQNLEKALKEIIRQRSFFANFIHWLSEDSFGTLDQIREEMDETYVAKRISLPVIGKSTLDCILIMGHNDQANSSNEDKTKFDTSKTTMIFCQPNAGYYESMLQDCEWIDFYLENGLNVFLWNYRGFARSSGTPNPDLIRRDGESVVDYLRQELGVKKIGVHGQSLGGLVATHLAKHKGLDYLCADRTFSELANIAELTYGRIAGALYRLITWWTDDISNDFLESTCYKVMAFDSNDEVINPLGSLKQGVMSKLAERKLIATSEPEKPVLKDYYSFFSPLRFVASAQSFSYFIRKTLYSHNVSQKLNDHHPLLSKQEGMALFCACRRVSDLILNVMQETFASMPREPKLSGSRSSSFSSNNKSKKKESQEADQSVDSTGISVENEAASPTKLLKKEKNLDNDNLNLQKIIKKKSYGHFLENPSYGSRYIQEIIPDISPYFEDLEAGGVQLLDIMCIDDEFQYRFFRHFLQSFEIFGALLPLDKVFDSDAKNPHSYQNNAISDIEIFIEHINKISKSIEQESSSQTPNDILYLVLEDLRVINSILKTLSSNLNAKIHSGASPRTSDSSPTVKMSETSVDKDHAQSLGDRLIDIESHKGVLTLGHLVPLTCGHNGIPHYMELEVLKHHLKNSNLLKS